MDKEPQIQILPRIEDSPEFWLGQIGQIVQLERGNKLSRSKAYTAIRDLMKRVNAYQGGRQKEVAAIMKCVAAQKG